MQQLPCLLFYITTARGRLLESIGVMAFPDLITQLFTQLFINLFCARLLQPQVPSTTIFFSISGMTIVISIASSSAEMGKSFISHS